MASQYLAKFQDLGDKNRIVAINKYPGDIEYSKEFFIPLTEEVYNYLTTAITTQKVFFTESAALPLAMDSLQFESLDILTEAKDLATIRCYNFLSKAETPISRAYYYEWLMSWSDLFNAGYVITDDNRETKYLEIVNTGNTVLIAKLERYLKALERMESPFYLYKTTIEFMDRVNESTDPAAISVMINDFLSKVTSGQ